jgi:hypothetical protein
MGYGYMNLQEFTYFVDFPHFLMFFVSFVGLGLSCTRNRPALAVLSPPSLEGRLLT